MAQGHQRSEIARQLQSPDNGAAPLQRVKTENIFAASMRDCRRKGGKAECRERECGRKTDQLFERGNQRAATASRRCPPEFVQPASFGEVVFTKAGDCAAAALRMMIDRGDNSEGEIAEFIRGIQIGYPRFSEEQLRERSRTVPIPGKADERHAAYADSVVETAHAS